MNSYNFASPLLFFAERDIKIVRPLYSVEVTETETARFETEISEEDVHGNWKLKGDALHQSPVIYRCFSNILMFIKLK